ncbi:hypothetical protein [Kozakia baliensis]|uniref:hypothetical protein n=1 Tax=Kozakia baliensis TaxID=153496 RepID=UPI00087CF05E|nr:hypothetical protein [Kozakia baliensis]AOX21061.1 hypothetical protein A0U90_00045 [Kozakia baliensis]
MRALKFSLPLAALIMAGGSHAATREEQSAACRGDAIRLCTFAIPNEAKITECMKKKIDQLSPRCRAMFKPANAKQGHAKKKK